MKNLLKIKSIVFIVLSNIASVYASENYDKLAIVAEIFTEDRNKVFKSSLNPNKYREIQDLIRQAPGVNFTRYDSDQYHISLECFNYDKPQDKKLHVKFGPDQVNYLDNMTKNFPKGSYKNSECYDMQLWCHSVRPNQDNLHFYFSNTSNENQKVKHINDIKTTLQNISIDYAHLVVRVGTKGQLRDKWNANIRKDKILDAPILPYRINDELKTHITTARINKRINQVNYTFSEDTDFELLKNIYTIASRRYNPVTFDIDTLAVTTRENNKIKYLTRTKL